MKAKQLMVVWILWVGAPGLASAQGTAGCPECVIGLFNDDRLCRNFGTFGDFTGSLADTLYLGIRYDPNSSFDALTGIEFSVYGMPTAALPPSWTARDGCTSVGPPAPVGTDTLTGTGGWNVVWSECQEGNKALAQVSMVSFSPFPNDTVIWIKRRYPPLDRSFPFPLFTQCDSPYFTKTSV